VMSNPKMFRYEWAWDKVNKYTNYLNAKRQPLRRHENILVFGAATCVYNPQMVTGKPYISRRSKVQSTPSYGKTRGTDYGRAVDEQHPCSVLQIPSGETSDVYHPNQKPLELMRYLVRTYTVPADTVLDFTAGSFSTGVACVLEGRNFIGIEQSAEYCAIGEARMKRASGQWAEVPRLNRRQIETPLFP
jgi:site-specific DNA-methyltransferase (adenine-specific)